MDQNIQEIINNLNNKVFIISDIMSDRKTFNETLESIYDYLKQGFEIKALRTCPVYFKFNDEPNSAVHTLQLRHFLTNLMFWEPIMRIGFAEKLDESYIVDCSKLSSSFIKSYVDNKIIIPYRKQVSNTKMNKVIHDMVYNLSRISTDFNIILGLSINIETFIDLSNRNPRFNEIIRTKLDETMQPSEIEEYLNNIMNEEIRILMNDPGNNMLKPILKSGTGIKHKQLAEFSINGGLKPDLDGNTIPVPINSNFIVGGLGNITNYYIDSLGGRKAVIMNKTVMGRSGHFARMVMLLCSGIKLSGEEACKSVHPVEFEIKTNKHLKRLRGRYYRLPLEREYKVLQGDETYLIGQKILVKSPATCASKKGICKQCYGELYHTNKDITIGAYAGAKITEPVSQNVLSSKHLLTTISESVEFNEEFYKFFSISSNEIILNTNNEEIDLNDYSLLLIDKNIHTIDEFDDAEFNHFVNLFSVRNKKTGEIYEMIEKSGEKDLYLSSEIVELLNRDKHPKEYYEIDFSKIDDESRLFIFEVENNELTKPLYSIMKLLNNSLHENCTIVDQMCQRMLDLLIESNISSDSVHGELLIHPLLRSADDILERPKFSKYGEESEYQILTVEAALEKHPSVLVSLSFQALGRQLVNPLTFKKKDTSFIDAFFRERP